uniref:uncharacterized protein LOC122604555 n=1 Tax=Erigeron canadensis TaxID=72917 RepID=UPI001CB99DFA|nr:uncharacterized protein LOC122604555 [Erigeron canadensis]
MNNNSRILQQQKNPRKRKTNIHIADFTETNPANGSSLYEVPITYQATNDNPESSKRGHPITKLKTRQQKKGQQNNTNTGGKQNIVGMESNSGYANFDESNLYDVDLATSSEYKKMRKSLYDSKNGISKEYIDMYDPTYICDSCQAMLWYGEAIRGNTDLKKKSYSLCCSRGKVQLPKLKEPPTMLAQLFHGKNPQSKDFIENIRQYNTMFSFTSMGGKIDHTYNKGGGPYNFRMHGQNYHSIGSLMPRTGQKPKFLQLYIVDTDNEVSHRFSAYSDSSENKGSITDPNSIPFLTVHQLKGMLDITNPLVKQFRMARDRISMNNREAVKLILVGRRGKDGRTYNLPTTNEVAALIIGDINGSGDKRDIILETKSGNLQRINELHPSYLALQYPLLFPFAEDGYRIDIPLRDVEDLNGPGRTRVSMRAFIAYRIQQRHQEESLILMSRKLLQQFLVDTYTMVENDRLYYVKCNQKTLRVADEDTICKAAESGQKDASKMGTQIFLPSSFTGGARYMQQNYMDAMALCNHVGYPDLFITFTCNPKWPEICRFLEKNGLKSEDRPDILTRMFKMKLDHLIKNIEDEHILGKASGVVYTVEFQKRGLPHAHICLFFEEPDKLRNPEDIDRVISAEIPDEEVDREFVVGYNPKLLKQYQGHMNIEWCNKLGAIKYLFKYINKGPDRITVGFPKKKQQSNKENQKENDVDEVAAFYDCRYISACEASWRLFAYDIHYQKPPVQRLSFHIKNRKPIVFDQHDQIADVVTKHTVKDSQFIQWMECNKNNEEARGLTYAKFPTKFKWNTKDKKWTRRTQGSSIGRINYVSPKHGETYYLRMLLNKIKGPTCYKDLKTVHGKVYKTYKETCYALGLLDGDEEYIQSIKETSTWATGSYCRSLFVMLITSDSLSRPEYVWDKTYDNLTEDILAIRRKELNEPDLELDQEAIKHIALAKIENMLLASGMSLKDIPNMPCPDFRYINMACNMLIQDELNYDKKNCISSIKHYMRA